MMKYIKTAIFTLLSTLFATYAFAGTARTYDIQLVVFSHLTAQTVSSEQWPQLSTADLSAFTTSTTPAQPATGLQTEINALQKNPSYRILFSGSWKRTWQGENGSVTIPFSNGNNLSGSMTVVLGHYFDVQTNLLFLQPTSALQKIDTSGYFNRINESTFGFKFMQNRRMRSNELNYLGEPVMGALIKILRINNNETK